MCKFGGLLAIGGTARLTPDYPLTEKPNQDEDDERVIRRMRMGSSVIIAIEVGDFLEYCLVLKHRVAWREQSPG